MAKRPSSDHLTKLVIALPDDSVGTAMRWLSDHGGRLIEMPSPIVMLPYNKNKPRQNEDPRVTGSRLAHSKGIRAGLEEKINAFIAKQGAGAKFEAGEITTGIGHQYDANFKVVLDRIVEARGLLRKNVGGAGRGQVKYLYSVPARRAMSDEERKAKDRARKQAERDAAKPKRDYAAERARAKARREQAAAQEQQQPVSGEAA